MLSADRHDCKRALSLTSSRLGWFMLRNLTHSVVAATSMVLGRALPAAVRVSCASLFSEPRKAAQSLATPGRELNSITLGYQDNSCRRFFSSGDDDDDGATTDFSSALETFWSPAVQQQLQAAAAGLPTVQENLSLLSPGGPEYVKQMRRVETLSTLQRLLHQLVTLQAETCEMEALAEEASASGDAAMKEEAQHACKQLEDESKAIKIELLQFLVPHDDADSMDAVLELRAGVGGGEASLWCSDMCGMYQRFCEQKGWGFEVVSSASTESGGMREVRGCRRRGCCARCRDNFGCRLCAPSAAAERMACCVSRAECIVFSE